MADALLLERRDERDRLRLLLEVSESIASHRDLNELFRDLAQRLPRIVPFDYINLVLHDGPRNVMRLHLLAVPDDSTFQAGMEFPIEESPGGLVWRTQQPLVVNHIALEDRFRDLISRLRDNGVQSFCVVPLTTALRRLGAMGFGSLRTARLRRRRGRVHAGGRQAGGGCRRQRPARRERPCCPGTAGAGARPPAPAARRQQRGGVPSGHGRGFCVGQHVAAASDPATMAAA